LVVLKKASFKNNRAHVLIEFWPKKRKAMSVSPLSIYTVNQHYGIGVQCLDDYFRGHFNHDRWPLSVVAAAFEVSKYLQVHLERKIQLYRNENCLQSYFSFNKINEVLKHSAAG